MYLPERLRQRLLLHFDSLVSEGEAIHKDIQVIPGKWHEPWLRSQKPYQSPDHNKVDWQRFVEWRTRCVSMLAQVLVRSVAHQDLPQSFGRLSNTKSNLEYGIATLKALKMDLQSGFLDDVARQIEASIAEDYLHQAQALMGEPSQPVSHIPAAVLAGAVLEKYLRSLCKTAEPEISTFGMDGKPFTLNRLIDEIKKADIITELRAKEFRFYADVRNNAAHGEFQRVTRADVEKSLIGIREFVQQTSTPEAQFK